MLTKIAIAQVEMIWQKCIGTSAGNEEAKSVLATYDGGYVIAGTNCTNADDFFGSGVHVYSYDFCFVKLNYNGVNILWKTCLGGNLGDFPSKIIQTLDGRYVAVGRAISNDGNVIGHHGSNNYDIWAVKLNTNGSLMWQKCFGGTDSDRGNDVFQTSDGGFIIAGTTSSTDYDVSGNHGLFDAWIIKMDSLSNWQWSKCYGGTHKEVARSVIQTVDGGYAFAGYTYSDDGDISGNHGNADALVMKLNAAGDIEWQVCLGGTDEDKAQCILQTDDGGYLIAARSSSNDGDVSGNHGGLSDIWVVKLDDIGQLQWQKCYGGSSTEYAKSLIKALDGNFIVSGSTSSVDGDVTFNNGTEDNWIFKINSSGDLIWQKTLGGSLKERAWQSINASIKEYMMVGRTKSNDGDVLGNHSSPIRNDFWSVKLAEDYNTMTGKMFYDLNSNNVMDSIDQPVAYHRVNEPTTGRFDYTDSQGNFNMVITDSGTHNISPDPVNYFDANPPFHDATFSTFYETDSLNDFAFQPIGSSNDLCISITPYSAFRPGFSAYYKVTYNNQGNTTINNVSVIFFKDAHLTFTSSTPLPTSVTADSVVWNIGTLTPFQTGNILITVTVNSGTPIGTLINSGVRIEPVAGDVNPTCNYSYFEILTSGSLDPNDIRVDRTTLFTNEFPNPPFLEYIIRFQNTGNDTAFNVVVNNMISQNLDLNTFEYIASSHPLNLDYNPATRNMKFSFDNILLPDIFANEPASHGFIHYRIKPVNTLVQNSKIYNSASIIFDFNQPIQTNTVITTVVLPVGIAAQSIPILESDLVIYPNPNNGLFTICSKVPGEIEFYDMTGRLLHSFFVRSSRLINNPLPKGAYLVRMKNSMKANKLIIW